MSQYSFSIFTPVYNRGGVLERVYNSLQRQTYSDIEWIIGSTDNTDLVIKDIINRANFPIKYIFLSAAVGSMLRKIEQWMQHVENSLCLLILMIMLFQKPWRFSGRRGILFLMANVQNTAASE